MSSRSKRIGILTAGGDSPGLNAAIRAITKAAIHSYGMEVFGIYDGFRGLVDSKCMELTDRMVSGILTAGGTILRTSREKPHKMPVHGEIRDMTDTAVENAGKMGLDCLVCLGGGGTQRHAFRLHTVGGLNVLTLPKTIDNDVVETDVTFGFDTARSIATEAIDRLHTTATSHQRLIVCETMGHNAGWLALESGIAGGADVILIPEIPYRLDYIADFLRKRRSSGKRFSIIAVAEGAIAKDEKRHEGNLTDISDLSELSGRDENRDSHPLIVERKDGQTVTYHLTQEPVASRLARQLQELTGMETRVTSLGHIQRGGVPTSFDRMLCTLLGTKAAELLAKGTYNVMVGYRNGRAEPVPLEKVAGFRKTVPSGHPLLRSACLVGTCLGDEQTI
ncbi:MAG: ATP-dependent 6-phosphofructokinase [Candidatus Aegiribacteria sp.]|nr:ATP-dependent 6-phosphofructokinase [Candidatus Aegiribacteria sp.]MBD3294453.1 ATP-dependent 6-phosphofructokinase [Candidatus Fermentibacteria bacterium]